jgi:hypothetical protein
MSTEMRSNEEALEIFADILEPAGEIIGDEEVKTAFRAGEKMKAIKTAIKSHKAAIIEILARLDGEEPENYHVGIFTLPAKILALLDNPEVAGLFTGAEQNEGGASSGSATEVTQGGET